MESLSTVIDLKIKRCTEDDIKALARVGQESYRQHYMHMWEDSDQYVHRSFSEYAIEQNFNNENVIYYLIKLKDKDVGMMKLIKDHKLKGYTDAEALEIEKIYLKKDIAGQGIGSCAIEYVVDLAKQMKKKVIWLNVMTSSNAYHFYLKLGFQPVGIYYLDYENLKNQYREMLTMKMEVD